MSIEQHAAIVPVEVALEVGIKPTFHHDAEHPYLDHSEPAHKDSSSSHEDDEVQATSASSRASINVYSAYSRLQQQTQYVVLSSNCNVHITWFTLALAEHMEIAVDVTYDMQVCILRGMHNFLPLLMLICFGNIALPLRLRNHRNGWSMFFMSPM